MQTVELPGKIADLCDAAGISVAQFRDAFLTEATADPRIVHLMLTAQRRMLRKPTPQNFITFWRKRGMKFDEIHFLKTRAEVREDLGIGPPLAADPLAKRRVEILHDLSGMYQVIRPHTIDPKAYILEFMELRVDGTSLQATFFSHNHPTWDFAYTGIASTAERYCFVLMFRKHEEFDGQQSFRCITFYVGDGRCDGTLSGLMLRGMRGVSTGKEAVALPFVAVAMDTAKHAADIVPAELAKPNKKATQLVRMYADEPFLCGEVRARYYKQLHALCDGIFSDPRIRKATTHEREMIIYTISPSDLRELNFEEGDWRKAVDAIRIEPQDAADGVSQPAG